MPPGDTNPTTLTCHLRHEIRHAEQHKPIPETGLGVSEAETTDSHEANAGMLGIDCHDPHDWVTVRRSLGTRRPGNDANIHGIEHEIT